MRNVDKIVEEIKKKTDGMILQKVFVRRPSIESGVCCCWDGWIDVEGKRIESELM